MPSSEDLKQAFLSLAKKVEELKRREDELGSYVNDVWSDIGMIKQEGEEKILSLKKQLKEVSIWLVQLEEGSQKRKVPMPFPKYQITEFNSSLNCLASLGDGWLDGKKKPQVVNVLQWHNTLSLN